MKLLRMVTNKLPSYSTFAITTFNILAPCYKNSESLEEKLWSKRNTKIISFLENLNTDIICLQEFWIKEPKFVKLYENTLKKQYPAMHFLNRTGGKKDGVAIFVRSNLKVEEVREIVFNDEGDRVALFMRIVEPISKQHFILVNTHLTFPHNYFDREILRKNQIVNLCLGY